MEMHDPEKSADVAVILNQFGMTGSQNDLKIKITPA
jgi:ribosomal protein S28E/S33